jgi:protein-S-isoprenylcysteine O-methyltransferase Ste14
LTLILRNLLFTVLVPGSVAVYGPLALAGDRSVSGGVLTALGIVALAVGAAIYGWCLWDFAVTGRATPFPLDAPRVLVVRGLYRYVRNPMYLGVLIVVVGWSLVFAAWSIALYGAVVAVGFHFFVVYYEEPNLTAAFGREYERYAATVPRWLPRVRQTF